MNQHVERALAQAGSTEDDIASEALQRTIGDIGLARFIGRINSGVISTEAGNAAVERFIASEQERPFLSLVSQALFGRRDAYFD